MCACFYLRFQTAKEAFALLAVYVNPTAPAEAPGPRALNTVPAPCSRSSDVTSGSGAAIGNFPSSMPSLLAYGVLAKGCTATSDDGVCRRLWQEFVEYCSAAARPPASPEHVRVAELVRRELVLP